MTSVQERLEALQAEASERGLTPLAWWIGEAYHDEVLEALGEDETVSLETEGELLAAIDGLDVKVLTESPQRFALWCEEGALDL